MKAKILSVTLAFILLSGAYGLLARAAPDGQGTTTFRGSVNITNDLDVDSNLNVDGNATVVGNSDVTGDTTITGTLNTADTDSVLTGAQTITPTYSYLQVSPVAVLTATLATSSAEDGDLLIIHNLVATTTTIVDTGATAGGGNITLGQDDIAGFIFGDGVWVEMFSPDNS